MRQKSMFDSRLSCPQCGSDQLKYQTPQTTQGKSAGIISVAFTTLLALAVILKLDLMGLFIVWMILGAALVFIPAFVNRRKVYRLKCQHCGHRWTMTTEEWLQAGDTPVRTKPLGPREKEEKRAVVESLINQIRKM
ncbi:hypothetical protein TFLX_01391 [Thermoflexales bacterium]|nr:hypothetical protein TFLX_01391 [Thermoflexales bacterium]